MVASGTVAPHIPVIAGVWNQPGNVDGGVVDRHFRERGVHAGFVSDGELLIQGIRRTPSEVGGGAGDGYVARIQRNLAVIALNVQVVDGGRWVRAL